MNKKNVLISFICILLPTVLTGDGATTLKNGDNLNNYYRQYSKFFTVRTKIKAKHQTGDMTVALTGHKDIKLGMPVVLSVQITNNPVYFIGVVQKQNNNSYILMDMDGNGTLDTRTNTLVLPYWIYFPLKIPRGTTRQYTKMLDDMYSAFQFEDGPMSPESSMQKSLNNLQQALTDTTTQNRDLFFAMNFYIAFSQKYKKASLACLKTLIQETKKRYKQKHPLLYLFLVESLINLDRRQEALKVNNHLLQLAPDCIAAQAYAYKLEEDKDKAKEKLKTLKEKYPRHWILKKLFKTGKPATTLST